MGEIKIRAELIEKAKTAKSVEELLALASENEVVLTEEEAKEYFEKLNPLDGELSDEELDNVAGGECGDLVRTVCYKCKSRNCKLTRKYVGRDHFVCLDCGHEFFNN